MGLASRIFTRLGELDICRRPTSSQKGAGDGKRPFEEAAPILWSTVNSVSTMPRATSALHSPSQSWRSLAFSTRNRPPLACIIHQRWKGRRTVVGIEDERQELRQIWDRARAREVGSDWEGISRQSSACHNQERVSSKQDELLSWCR
jgi:hypothetical protein